MSTINNNIEISGDSFSSVPTTCNVISIYNSPVNLTEMENEIDRNMLATELTG
jgi:hypothetical protein